jgi:hypothetical protein
VILGLIRKEYFLCNLFLLQLYWHGMIRLQPETFIVMVDMGDGWKKIQEYPTIYNAFQTLEDANIQEGAHCKNKSR